MKILHVAVFTPNSTNVWQADGFEALGHEVIRYDYRARITALSSYKNRDLELITLCQIEKPDIIIVKGWLGQIEIPLKWEQTASAFVTSSFIIKQEVFKEYYNPPFNLEVMLSLDYAWWDKHIFYTEHKI